MNKTLQLHDGTRIVMKDVWIMPSILIETRRETSTAHEEAVMEAVHVALCEAFKIKPEDKNVRLIAHAPHRFMCPPGKSKPELYTHIGIDAT